jgi:hypothetical protein
MPARLTVAETGADVMLVERTAEPQRQHVEHLEGIHEALNPGEGLLSLTCDLSHIIFAS